MRNLHQLFDWQYKYIIGEDFAKFCGLLRIYELYRKKGLLHNMIGVRRTQTAEQNSFHQKGTDRYHFKEIKAFFLLISNKSK